MRRMLLVVGVLVSASPLTAATQHPAADDARLAMTFEANAGQTAPEVRFLSRGAGYTLFLTDAEAVLALHGSTARPDGPAIVRMRLLGARAAAKTEGLDERAAKVNYFKGGDRRAWRSNVSTYGKVAWRDVYPGVDVVFYGDPNQLEYDFVIDAGADPGAIRLAFAGVDAVRVAASGDLVLATGEDEIVQKRPVVYQQTGATRKQVEARYVLAGSREVAIAVGAYDPTAPLVVDPVLVYSTYLGGSATDIVGGIAADHSGAAYVTGVTTSLDFPSPSGIPGSGQDVFVSKLDASGKSLVYTTFLAGGRGYGIAVDDADQAYVTGSVTDPKVFPVTAGSLQPSFGGGSSDAFVTRLDASGAIDYSTFLGGPQDETGLGIAVDAQHTAYVTGMTQDGFPTYNPFQPKYAGGGYDGFVARLDGFGSALLFSSYLGGSRYDGGSGIAVDGAGNAYVAGFSDSPVFPDAPRQCRTVWNLDAVVVKVDAFGHLLYSACIGGRDAEFGRAIAVDRRGTAYVTGDTLSIDFPVVNALQATNAGNYDGFVFRLDPSGSSLLFSTYLGGVDHDHGSGIALDNFGNVYVAGLTSSVNFPVLNALQAYGGGTDAFLTKLTPSGSAFIYSTFLGGTAGDGPNGTFVAVDVEREVHIAGSTMSLNFPLVTPYQAAHASPGQYDGFVARVH